MMPSSFVDSIPAVTHLVIANRPRLVVDIGPGWGKYGLLCREYLRDLEMIVAVEVPEGRLFTQDAIYDDIIEQDARTLTAEQWQIFDLALLIDVIEHMPRDDGHKLLTTIQSAGCPVLVSTPKVFGPQFDPNNPYETHLSLWSWEDFRPHGIIGDESTIDSIIFLLEAR